MSSPQQDLSSLNTYQADKSLLKNKLILITGATDGIGCALANSCSSHGASLILLAKNENKLDSLIENLEQENDQLHQSYSMDLAKAGELDYIKFAEFLATRDQAIDSLVLNAGVIEALQGLRNYPFDTWLRTITVNQHAPFMLSRCCIPILEQSPDPSIVFSSHECNKAYWGAYAVAKSAQLSMMKILADELDSDKPIRVNAVDPSPVRTKLRMPHFPGVDPETFAAAEEVLAPYLFFIGPDSQGITGQNHKVNPDFTG